MLVNQLKKTIKKEGYNLGSELKKSKVSKAEKGG